MNRVRPHLGPLLRHARRLAGSLERAEDLVQETLLRAWSHAASFQAAEQPGPWLRRVMTRIFISELRHAKVVAKTAARPDIAEHVFSPVRVDACQHPEAALQRAELGRAVDQAFGCLSRPYRSVVEAVDVRGLAYREAAAELGIPVGTVMSRLHRARHQLRREIGLAAGESALG